MKKLLALVLALVMTFSLATVSTNAAFSDSSAIYADYTVAVDLMSQLGIINGMGDGTFAPAATLTRAQAAKIIAYMLLGTKTADALVADEAVFNDVPETHWAAPYIGYCVSEGIVDGYGDGNFGPDDKLTGYAFGKMLLTALDVDGVFTGIGWDINVAVALKDNGLDEDLDDVNLGDPLERQQAAQLAKNALLFEDENTKRWEVYDGDRLIGTYDEAADAYVIKKSAGADGRVVAVGGASLLSEVFNGASARAFVVANCETGAHKVYTDETSELDVAHPYTTFLTEDGRYLDFDVQTDLDMIGHYVEIYYGLNDNGAPDTYDNNWEFTGNYTKDDKHDGTFYAMIDLSRVVTVEEEQEKITSSAVKTLFGVSVEEDGHVRTGMAFVNEIFVGGYAPLAVAATGNSDKYTVAAGRYVFAKPDGSDKEDLVAVCTNETTLDALTIEITSEEDNFYSVTGSDGKVYIDLAEDSDDSVNLVLNEFFWTDLINTDDEVNDGSGKAVEAMILARHGELYTISPLETVYGKITKVVSNSAKETYQIFVNGKAYDYDIEHDYNLNDALEKMLGDDYSGNVKSIYADGAPEVATYPYCFFLNDEGKIFAYAVNDVVSLGGLLIPVELCYLKNFEDDELDDYGNSKSHGTAQYSWYLQCIDTRGKEVLVDLVWDDEIQWNAPDEEWSGADRGIKTFLTYVEDGAHTISPDGIPGAYAEGQGYVTNTEALNRFYTMTNKAIRGTDGSTSDNFFDAEELDGGASCVLTNDEVKAINKDSVKFSANGNPFYTTDEYTVIAVTGTGKDLKVKLSRGTLSKLVENAVIFGYETASGSGKYNLAYILIPDGVSPYGTAEGTVFIRGKGSNMASKTYTDKNGKSITTRYYSSQSVWEDDVKKSFNVDESLSDNLVPGIFDYSIDEYSGLYILKKHTNATENGLKITAQLNQSGTATNVNGLLTIDDGSLVKELDLNKVRVVNTTAHSAANTSPTMCAEGETYQYSMFFVYDDTANESGAFGTVEEDENVYIYLYLPLIPVPELEVIKDDDTEYTFRFSHLPSDTTYSVSATASTTPVGVDVQDIVVNAKVDVSKRTITFDKSALNEQAGKTWNISITITAEGTTYYFANSGGTHVCSITASYEAPAEE